MATQPMRTTIRTSITASPGSLAISVRLGVPLARSPLPNPAGVNSQQLLDISSDFQHLISSHASSLCSDPLAFMPRLSRNVRAYVDNELPSELLSGERHRPHSRNRAQDLTEILILFVTATYA